jgi:hypothetical protein
MSSSTLALESLSRARAIADYAKRLGVSVASAPQRPSTYHVGAALADAVLQSGLNYQAVVRRRVGRIQMVYPEAATLPGVREIVAQGRVSEFLDWRHSAKITRFVHLVALLDADGVQCAGDLRVWLGRRGARDRLLELHGIGPKTYDYICCLVGMDRIAVDRHVKTFANEAGVSISSYEELQLAVSYAADLLGLARRDFDAWIWGRLARQVSHSAQLALF